MKQIMFTFDALESLENKLQQIHQVYHSGNHSAALFHILTKEVDEQYVSDILEMIYRIIPEAQIAGCTSNGHIVDGDFCGSVTAASCMLFEYTDTRIEVLQFPLHSDGLQAADELLEALKSRPWVKGIELLATIRGMSMTRMCERLSDAEPELHIFGGGALSAELDSDAAMVFSYVPMRKGVVFTLYGGPELHIATSCVTGWQPLGSRFTVTDSDGYYLKMLNDRPAFEMYSKYLNIGNDENFFSNTREFPLFYRYHGIDILRAPIASNPDGSLTMTSDVEKGVTVRLSYGDPWAILEAAWDEGKHLLSFSPDAILVFSCAGRRTFWGNKEVGSETEVYQSVAPTFGFYTSGEFLRTGKWVNQHNVTQVIVAMREGDIASAGDGEVILKRHRQDGKASMISRLATFIKVTTDELEEANRKLSELAVVDTLTGVGNKNAYFEKIRELDEHIGLGTADFCVAIFDMNGLKVLNDSLGHECGDKALMFIAGRLIQVFGRDNLFRIGGDEFMGILKGVSDFDMKELFLRLDKAMEGGKICGTDIAVSKGYVLFHPGEDKTYRDVSKRADAAMYEDKERYYMAKGMHSRHMKLVQPQA